MASSKRNVRRWSVLLDNVLLYLMSFVMSDRRPPTCRSSRRAVESQSLGGRYFKGLEHLERTSVCSWSKENPKSPKNSKIHLRSTGSFPFLPHRSGTPPSRRSLRSGQPLAVWWSLSAESSICCRDGERIYLIIYIFNVFCYIPLFTD